MNHLRESNDGFKNSGLVGNFRSQPVMKLSFFEKKNRDHPPASKPISHHSRKPGSGTFFNQSNPSKIGEPPTRSVLSYRFKPKQELIQHGQLSQNIIPVEHKIGQSPKPVLNELLSLPVLPKPELVSVKK